MVEVGYPVPVILLKRVRTAQDGQGPMAICETRPRLLPDRVFPSYAYLPGRFPHPVRHPLGHSYDPAPASSLDEISSDPEALLWGMDLFNHGFYWEAHEAWEPLWRAADQGSANRAVLKGLILTAAAGVKRREGKAIAAGRHGQRAAALLRDGALGHSSLAGMLGISLEALAAHAELTVSSSRPAAPDQANREIAFDFLLGIDFPSSE